MLSEMNWADKVNAVGYHLYMESFFKKTIS